MLLVGGTHGLGVEVEARKWAEGRKSRWNHGGRMKAAGGSRDGGQISIKAEFLAFAISSSLLDSHVLPLRLSLPISSQLP
ncbi:hypothetical protein Pmani_039032 [Petrolisthes manimaculis]|uniref:Uncharacterized protein n=1 Tax=Petrolisthes manimaculis TaxID=1843537 RepID=A0AAE1ND98_9EUCA|nr:hypothetical protein Pmani_039032 [Petrolisthes manimaculis]